MIIVDTTVWIDYLGGTTNPQTSWLESEIDRQRIGLTDLIFCEVLQGVRDDTVFSQFLQDFSRFHVFHTGGTDLAIAAAQNYRFLRGRGHTVRKTIDCLIATFCLQEGHGLLHRDRDFDLFEEHLGLRVVHP
jgi:predicted nucleic acid-binding protein